MTSCSRFSAQERGKLAGIQMVDLARIVGKMATWGALTSRDSNRAVKRGGKGTKNRSAVAGTTPRGGELAVLAQPVSPLDIGELADELADRSPSPEQMAVANDEAVRVRRMQVDPVWPEILRLRLEGCPIAEVARKTGRSFSSVQRQLDLVWTRWNDSGNSD